MKPSLVPLALACLLPLLTACAPSVVAEKVNFGADHQGEMTRYLRDCAAVPLPDNALRKPDEIADALAGDRAVDCQKSGCLEVGARHIESVQQHYGDNK